MLPNSTHLLDAGGWPLCGAEAEGIPAAVFHETQEAGDRPCGHCALVYSTQAEIRRKRITGEGSALHTMAHTGADTRRITLL